MKLSTKGRYGARLMLELALCYEKGTILLKDIAGRQEISEGYLEQILPLLKAAGLVNSSRGAHGGYTLANPPSEITLGEVVRAVEGTMAIVECVATPEVCHRVDFCVTRDIWEEMSEKMMGVLDSTTLQDMVNLQRQKLKSQPLMYYI